MIILCLAIHTAHGGRGSAVPVPSPLPQGGKLIIPTWSKYVDNYVKGHYKDLKALVFSSFNLTMPKRFTDAPSMLPTKTIIMDEPRIRGNLLAPEEEEKVIKTREDLKVGGQQSSFPRPYGSESYLMPEDLLVLENHNMKDYLGEVKDLDKRPQLLNPAAVTFTPKEFELARADLQRMIRLNGGYIPVQSDIEQFLDTPAYLEAYTEAALSRQYMTLTRNPFELSEQAYFTSYYSLEKLEIQLQHMKAMSLSHPNEPNYLKNIENLEKSITQNKQSMELKLRTYYENLTKKIPIVAWRNKYIEAKTNYYSR